MTHYHYKLLFLFCIVALSPHLTFARDAQCFVSGEYINSQFIDITISQNENQCLSVCKENSNCSCFTYLPSSASCIIFYTCGEIDATNCSECISGERECTVPEPICFVQGVCHGDVIHTEDLVR